MGTMGDYPPTEEESWNSFAATLPTPAVHDLVTHARPLTDIASFRFPENRRLLYERQKRFPLGYLVIGDAVCSFNPMYGQSMSVAAMEAKALDDCLEARDGLEGLQRSFFRRARRIVDVPWTLATGEDLRYPQAGGRRPLSSRLLDGYLERVHAVASANPTVCRRFFDVLNLLAPPASLLSPPLVWRVLRHPVPQGEGSPWGDLHPRGTESEERHLGQDHSR
jgi:2-polyprenyl-6-methoxyphenol hydroxylase-like FAD-dependent oxidoreductase